MKPELLTVHSPDEVFNQPPALENYNLFECDVPLREALHREGAGWFAQTASEYGELLGRAETLHLGELANRFTPQLRTHDRFGHRLDEVEFHPAWHELMSLGISHKVHSLPWKDARSGIYAARAALMMLRHQIDEGSSCPLTMTFAVIPSLRLQPELADEWEARVLSNEYDSRFIPSAQKRGALFGMAMTERQGGSDVRANTTRAVPLSQRGAGREYAITGHKWFCSAPMCDAFLVLAQTEGGLSCFLLPRWKPDGTRNAFHLLRLKDKLGNRSNASSEVEFRGAWARMIGEEGRGVASIMEMVRHTRLDCCLGSAAAMHRAVAEITHHAHYRFAFGKRLIEQPLMMNVLADLCLESEAATAFALRLARGFDEACQDECARKLIRIVTAVGKYWITRRAVTVVGEALECLGGNGYIEESPLPRIYRDVPVNSVWEGAGNIQCLDVLRAIQKEPDALEIVLDEIRQAKALNPHYDQFVDVLREELCKPDQAELRARRNVELLAIALQAAILLQNGHAKVAEAFCASRCAARSSMIFGTLPDATDFTAIIDRARPKLKGKE